MIGGPFRPLPLSYWFDRTSALHELVTAADVDLANDIAAVRRRVIEQGIVIEELTAMVSVMARMLTDAGQLDADVFRHRVVAELEARRTPPETKTPARCVQCNREGFVEEMSATAFGPTCRGGCAAPGGEPYR